MGCHRTSLNFVDHVWELFGPLAAGIPVVILDHNSAGSLVRMTQVALQLSFIIVNHGSRCCE